MSCVLYGRAGTGKTTLSSTFPGPVLLADIRDRGTDSVSDVKGLSVTEVESWTDLEDLYWYLKEGDHGFKTVVLDTVTQLQQVAIEKVLQDKKKDVDSAGDWGTMTKREWGDVAALMKTWITNFRDLPLNVVFIAQERIFNVGEEEDADGMLTPEVGPRLSPSVASTMNAAVSWIGCTFVRQRTFTKKTKLPDGKVKTKEETKLEYCLRIGPSPVYITKGRKPKSVALPDIIVDPTYEALSELMKGTSNGTA